MKVALFRQRITSIAPVCLCISASVLLFELAACQTLSGSLVETNRLTSPSRSAEKPSVSRLRPTFERGIAFPRWGRDGFGPADTAWVSGLNAIQKQTGAKWLELPIQLAQDSGQTVTVHNNEASLPQYVHQAVVSAHARGYKVFMIPLLLVHIQGGWAGSVQLSGRDEQVAWFDSFFAAYKPYLQLAQDESVEQVSIGTEIAWMQANAPSDLWTRYIDEVRSIYRGSLTYDTNWSDIPSDVPDWMHDSRLAAIGVSEYIPLTDVQRHLAEAQIRPLWITKIQHLLDDFSNRLGKHLILSEIGYRDSWDTFWHTWDYQPHPPEDSAAQAAGVGTALSVCLSDPHISGTFFWGWQDTGPFDLAGRPAAKVIYSWYTK